MWMFGQVLEELCQWNSWTTLNEFKEVSVNADDHFIPISWLPSSSSHHLLSRWPTVPEP